NTNEEFIQRYLDILKSVDTTVKNLIIDLKENGDIPIDEDDEFQSKDVIIKNIRVDVSSVHDVYKEHKKVSEVELPFLKYESNGTIKLFGILPSIFEALDTGGVLFIDELENGLHPLVVEFIIKLFNDTSINPKNAQLICSTHNTLLLEKCRRDQVWFMDKNEYGESKLSRLSDFLNIRKNDNISEKYLKGVFGAIPKF
ncbi:AAA family ATPase, partial [Intestinibacter bartlettii]|uniref:AAA family ATPase n=1 Tax=Intestinibacter bartlettii TaxID=261299 RepID=UPI003995A65F